MQKERTGGGVLPWLRSDSSQRRDAKPALQHESKRNLRKIVRERVARAKDLLRPCRAPANSSRHADIQNDRRANAQAVGLLSCAEVVVIFLSTAYKPLHHPHKSINNPTPTYPKPSQSYASQSQHYPPSAYTPTHTSQPYPFHLSTSSTSSTKKLPCRLNSQSPLTKHS